MLCGGCGIFSGANRQADFSLQISAPSLTVSAGGAPQPLTITAAGLNGFNGAIHVTVAAMPAGVTATPSSFTLSAGSSQIVNFAAGPSAAAATSTVQIQGVSGNLSHNVPAPILVTPKAVNTGTDVVTYHFDIGRTGLNPFEAQLTPASVKSATFGLIRVLPSDGKVDAQPLYLANLTLGGKPHNVIYMVSEHDTAFAYDADSGILVWKRSVLGAGERPSGDFGCGQISPEIGITATPVIDRHTGPHGVMFLVGMTVDQAGNFHHRLHALDVATGAEMEGSPVEIQATYPGTGEGSTSGTVTFSPKKYAERVGLLLMNGTLYLGWTSHCDSQPYTGWLMAYSETTLTQTAVLNLTPNGSEGSIWMAGSGLAADGSGNIYFLDANGTFDTTLDAKGFPVNHDFGNGFIKVSTAGGKLAVADYFESFDTVAESSNDQDLGSGGVIVLPDQQDASGNTRHLAIGAGKAGHMYLVDRDNLGKFSASDNSAIYQEVDGALAGIWSMPAYFNQTIYYGGINARIKAFPINQARVAGAATALSNTEQFPYPGATPAVSALGTMNGIVWAVENASPAVLHALNAGTLKEIYNSNQAANGRDQFGDGNKFITPAIADGRVLVGTPTGVAEFGLLK